MFLFLRKSWPFFSIGLLIAFIIVMFLMPSIMNVMAWIIIIINVVIALLLSAEKEIKAKQEEKIDTQLLARNLLLNFIGIIIILLVSILIASKASVYIFILGIKLFGSTSPLAGQIIGLFAGILTGIVIGLVVGLSLQWILRKVTKLIIK